MKQENIKIVEIRDRITCIPAFAIRIVPSLELELFLFSHCGYDIYNPCILLISIQAPWLSARSSDEWHNSPRTMPTAHKWIEENFDSIQPGQVIDVEYILKEKDSASLGIIQERAGELKRILDNDEL